MANKSATIDAVLTYESVTGATLVETVSVTSTYEALTVGTVDVADTTASATTIAIPFGGVSVGASAILVRNRTGQELEVLVNGASPAAYRLPTGGAQLIMSAGHAATTPVSSLSVKTTATQSGTGYIDFFVLGDNSP